MPKDRAIFQDDEGRWQSGCRPALEELVRTQMGSAAELTVPLDVSVGTGRTWEDAGH